MCFLSKMEILSQSWNFNNFLVNKSALCSRVSPLATLGHILTSFGIDFNDPQSTILCYFGTHPILPLVLPPGPWGQPMLCSRHTVERSVVWGLTLFRKSGPCSSSWVPIQFLAVWQCQNHTIVPELTFKNFNIMSLCETGGLKLANHGSFQSASQLLIRFHQRAVN